VTLDGRDLYLGRFGSPEGRADVRESEPIKPVPEAFIDAIEPHVSRQVWALVQVPRFSGMRPGEAVGMRTCDLDTSGRVWIYTPGSHKTEHHGKRRAIYLGPQAQDVLREWLRPDLAAPLFQPGKRRRNGGPSCGRTARLRSNLRNSTGASPGRRNDRD
jgi:integrase